MNAVACEVQVTATGARPSQKGGQRELFTEETTTALVFENGGVLRLAAAVVPGQLLFLTHKESKREVVAQVTRKRDFRPMICYVEVEFSEPAPGFWGIAFSEAPALSATAPQQKEADGSGQDAEAIFSSEPIAPAHAPSAQEIAMLNEEVEALREQLKLLQAQKTTGSLPAPAGIPDLSRNTAPEPPPAIVNVPAQAPVLAEAHGEPSTKLPTGTAEPAFSEEDLLPKPALDFKAAKPPAKFAPKPEQKVAAASHPAAMRKDLLFAAFVLIVAGAAWYQNLLPGLPLLKSLFSNTAPSSGTHPVAIAPRRQRAPPPLPASFRRRAWLLQLNQARPLAMRRKLLRQEPRSLPHPLSPRRRLKPNQRPTGADSARGGKARGCCHCRETLFATAFKQSRDGFCHAAFRRNRYRPAEIDQIGPRGCLAERVARLCCEQLGKRDVRRSRGYIGAD